MLLPSERALVHSKIVANQLTFAILLVFFAMRGASLDPMTR